MEKVQRFFSTRVSAKVWLWFILNLLDVNITLVAYVNGHGELNPVMLRLIAWPVMFLSYKISFTFLAYLILKRVNRLALLWLLNIAMIVVVIWGIMCIEVF